MLDTSVLSEGTYGLRWAHLLRVLDEIHTHPRKKISYTYWYIRTGWFLIKQEACVLGWIARDPWFKHQGWSLTPFGKTPVYTSPPPTERTYEGFHAGEVFFGLHPDEWMTLFTEPTRESRTSEEDIIQRCKHYYTTSVNIIPRQSVNDSNSTA